MMFFRDVYRTSRFYKSVEYEFSGQVCSTIFILNCILRHTLILKLIYRFFYLFLDFYFQEVVI